MRSIVLLILSLMMLVGCRSDESAEPSGEAAAVAASYAGDEACASCHAELYASYHRTGMGRSVSRFDPAAAPERFDAEGRSPVVYNENFDFYYQAFVRGDTLFQREFRLDESGDVIHERVHRADYVVGSGNATRSYLMRVGGYVTEMPLTWYVERAIWDMSPGYYTSNSRFSRPANLECMTCHNGLPEPTPFTQNHYAELPLGITCERCHGPAADHVEARLAGNEPAPGAPDPHLVDLASLDREAQLSVCQQCHLEGLAVFKPGEDPTTFRPGEPLASHRTVFARLDKVEDPDDFGIASHALRLALSACFEESAMTCTTCHDPHQPTAELGADWFNSVCQSCHGGDGDPPGGAVAHEALCERPGVGSPAEAMTGDCVSCHMQTGGTSDIPHVSFTDHWIRRELPPARAPGLIERDMSREEPFVLVNLLDGAQPMPPGEADLEAALAYFHFYETVHPQAAYLPDVAARIRRGLAAGADRVDARVALGRALAEMDSLAAAERVLGEAVAAYPGDAWAQYWLGTVRDRRGKAEAAEAPLRRAVEIQPLLVEARIALADVLSEMGRTDEAVQHLEAAVAADSLHHPAAWNNLGFLYLQAGRMAAAERPLATAVRLDPDFAEARVNLGAIYLSDGRLDPAIEQFEQAIRARPDYAPAYGNLGVAYVQLGRTADARRMFERLLTLSPGDQRARAYLAELGAAG
ncbi:MAG: tetratricopeptide repeat protein [Rhodothermales bacterium]